MKVEDILQKHGKCERKLIEYELQKLADSMFERWNYTEDFSSMTILINGNCFVEIGKAGIKYGCNKYSGNKAGYVLAKQHIFHEYRHVQQFSTERQKIIKPKDMTEEDRIMTNIVRRQMISSYYSSAYTHNYKFDPGEMDAEAYGLQNVLTHFESDPIVSKEEVKEILFEIMMSEDYGHKEELERYNPTSIEDIIGAFKDMRIKNIYIMYPITAAPSDIFGNYKVPETDMAKQFLIHPLYEVKRQELKKCTNGLEKDKLMEQTIIQQNPNISIDYPRLVFEINKCKKQLIGKRIKTGEGTVSISDMKYTGKTIEEDIDSPESIKEFTKGLESLNNINNEMKQ